MAKIRQEIGSQIVAIVRVHFSGACGPALAKAKHGLVRH